MYVPLGDGGVYVIFILTYAGVRDVLLAANADLWVFIGLWGIGGGRRPELSEAGKRDGGNPGPRRRPGWESRTVVGRSRFSR